MDVDTVSAGDPNPSIQLATLVVEGTPVDHSQFSARLNQPAANINTISPNANTLRQATIKRKRQVIYKESEDGKSFFLNGKPFDMNRIDFETTLGLVEEWTIINNTDERHTFHIHQIDFLVTDINGDDEDAMGLRDNIDIPYRDPVTKEPGTVTLIIPFTNPEIVGKFLFHCHISEHSDNGMMANILVKTQ